MSYTPADYIRWVKLSLNQHMKSRLSDDGVDTLEYRSTVRAFQSRYGITPNGEVNKPTQDKLIWLNHADPAYARWANYALHTYLAGLKTTCWHSGLNEAVKLCEAPMPIPIDAGWIGPQVEYELRIALKVPVRHFTRPGKLTR